MIKAKPLPVSKPKVSVHSQTDIQESEIKHQRLNKMAENVKVFLDKMDSLRERQNQVDPRDVFMMEKMKLLNEN